MREICPVFNTHRMVRQYAEEYYLPAHERHLSLSDNKLQGAKSLAVWRSKVQRSWPAIKFLDIKSDGKQGMKVGESLDVHAAIELGGLVPGDVSVEIYHGSLDSNGEIVNPLTVMMTTSGKAKGTQYEFDGTIKSETSGRHGYTIRILPRHKEIDNPLKQGLVIWA